MKKIFKRKCIICKIEFKTEIEKKILCSDFDCKKERQRQLAIKRYYRLKKKKLK